MRNKNYFKYMAGTLLAAGLLLSACGNQAETGTEAENAAASEEASGSENGASEAAGGSGETELVLTEFSEVFKDFDAVDAAGNAVDETIFSQKDLTMINVWATFCTPCLNEMPDLGELNAEYQAAGESFQIVGIVTDVFSQNEDGSITADADMVAKANELIEATGADYTHIIPEGSFAYSLMMSGELQAVPTTVFVNSAGEIVDRTVVGSRSKENWQTIIDEKLEKTGA